MMRSSAAKPVPSVLIIFCLCCTGCAAFQPRTTASPASAISVARQARVESPASQVQQVTFQERIKAPPSLAKPQSEENPFADAIELSLDTVVDQVQSRNPSLVQMMAAWQAASARYPQVRSLEDPMFGFSQAPGAIGSNMVEGGYRLDISQKMPFPGKRQLRGASAVAEADAAGNEIEDMRLQLIESAKNAFYEYYLVGRALAVNEENLKLLKSFKANAETRYKGGLAPQQDILQADVELGKQQERQLELEQKREIAIARLNTLMSLPPDLHLPPSPIRLQLPPALPDVRTLRDTALAQRPDLQALANRLQAEEAAVSLARREFLPDAELMAAYDAFWQEKPLRTMVGVRFNLPVQLRRRLGALDEARAKVAQRSAELSHLTNNVNFEVQQAYEQARKGEKTVVLYTRTLLPAAEANVKTAQAEYVTGKLPFLSLIEAQRNLIELRDRYYETITEYFRSLATLERAVGGSLSSPAAPQLLWQEG